MCVGDDLFHDCRQRIICKLVRLAPIAVIRPEISGFTNKYGNLKMKMGESVFYNTRHLMPRFPAGGHEKAVMVWDPAHGFQLKPLDELIAARTRTGPADGIAQARYDIPLDREIDALNRQLKQLSDRIESLHRKRMEMRQRPDAPLKPVFAPDQPLNPIPSRDR